MHVLAIEVDIRLPHAESLKDRRRVVASLLDRARARFEVAAAEVGGQDSHNLATLGFAVVSSSPAHCEEVMERVESLVWSRPELEVIETTHSWLD